MGKIVAIEGVDGAGKFTVSKSLKALIEDRGKTATIVSFPRYSETIAGQALGNFLSGKTYIPEDPKSIATLYAMDRFESKSLIESINLKSDFLIFDRYIASNMAYQSAKVDLEFQDQMIEWVLNLELKVFGLPAPNLNAYLRISPNASAKNVLRKPKRDYTDLDADRHEADSSLLTRVPLVYENLIAKSVLGEWCAVDVDFDGNLRRPEELAAEILTQL
ncbi:MULTISPECIES: thymidylate kinase [Mesorhizobium]|uniref:thymidylate kinase n=5 Tax=Phyllobacteriaceae TaxID=69277 RepID=UPI000FCA677B|nr:MULTISPECIES: thymidylate kinase [Mesorhizobium]RVB36431.1 thymidylate kinase [Mesorhizobium sp. M7A.F.Ca.CA.004.05.1.1]MCF6122988.1 hypothetical protein [Mesorhizobium ciceri]MCQ8816850.1 hypothetical protein [Mesorhizobium sp. SEMIA396]RUX70627.1 thymidylate kinase [Mesorhizobium sp. M7A.F.Ca.CA.004.08.2.1]RUX88319.1 thymidylate kinase [Mesorhizobium sp. M7A.F.Ca.CA.004.08.1.1]